MGKYGRLLLGFLVALLLTGATEVTASAKETIFNSSYVSFSPDNLAWTTNAGEQKVYWYPRGTRVTTGIASSLRELTAGEHYYRSLRTGEVPIGYWQVEHEPAKCIHSQYPPEGLTYHGLTFRRQICYAGYDSGWSGFCADCGAKAAGYVYMTKAAAESIDYLPADMEYYYICPFCTNLEQGAVFTHLCKKISANRYKVTFVANAPGVSGYMEDEFYMYDNCGSYEGESVTVRTTLPANQYQRTGYVFSGWNTKPDGGGEAFADGQEILNLSDENWELGSDRGIVMLYACWEPASSTLQIDPAGGTFRGKRTKTSIPGAYGESITIDEEELVSPSGYLVRFDTRGGEPLEALESTKSFVEWSRRQPFYGVLKANRYYYKGEDGCVDLLTAVYRQEAVVLPQAVREGWSFGGWYFDSKCTKYAGRAGELLTPSGNLTLYACWAELVLTAQDNYLAYEGSGAVDLAWTTTPVENSIFRVLQSRDGITWQQLSSVAGGVREGDCIWNGMSAGVQTITVPETGLYRLTVQGASGGNVSQKTGGKGGSMTASFWLQKGEILTLSQGRAGQGGPTGSTGGEATSIISDRQGLLLMAGGGGGATALLNGESGGSEAGLRKDGASEGESGTAGGGAGYVGGTAGMMQIHSHADCDRHEHDSMCYEMHVHTVRCYEINLENIANDAVERKACGCQVQKHHYRCRVCGNTWTTTTYNSVLCIKNHYDNAIRNLDVRECHKDQLICTLEEKNYLTCTLPQGYLCGRREGEVEISAPAFGGSNYCSGKAICILETKAGTNRGDGKAMMEALLVGTAEAMELPEAEARDLVAPDAPVPDSFTVCELPGGILQVNWKEPEDHGTAYYHLVEMYLQGETDTPELVSNRTENTLVSGVKAYYVVMDTRPNTVAEARNGTYVEKTTFRLQTETSKTRTGYLHVAAVDRAGNVGETVHIPLEEMAHTDPDRLQTVNLSTAPVLMKASESTYRQADGLWYVRADGKTPFYLTVTGSAESDFAEWRQLNALALENLSAGDQQRFLWQIPFAGIEESDETVSRNLVEKTSDAGFPLKQAMALQVQTFDYGSTMQVEQGFLLTAGHSGELLELMPRAAVLAEGELWSDEQEDCQNSLKLMGDGEAPALTGLETLEGSNGTAFRNGSTELVLRAEDALSGLSSVSLHVLNTDNTCEATFCGDAAGEIRVRAKPEEPLWAGNLLLTVTATDHVGNSVSLEYTLSGLSLTISLERVLERKIAVSAAGEAGLLTIRVEGHTRELQITFPSELTGLNPELNRTLLYDGTKEELAETISFFVPLYTPAGERLPVTVRAIGVRGETAEATAYMAVVGAEQSILNDLRTRLR